MINGSCFLISYFPCLKISSQPLVRIAPAHDAHAAPIQPVPEPELKTVAKIKAINPYDFPPQGFRCTVTLTRYNEDQTWWFPSCNRCSKSCLPEGTGYRCPIDKCTGYKFKYKPFYYRADATTDTELIFFDAVGTRLTDKDVRQLVRAYRGSYRIQTELAVQVTGSTTPPPASSPVDTTLLTSGASMKNKGKVDEKKPSVRIRLFKNDKDDDKETEVWISP